MFAHDSSQQTDALIFTRYITAPAWEACGRRHGHQDLTDSANKSSELLVWPHWAAVKTERRPRLRSPRGAWTHLPSHSALHWSQPWVWSIQAIIASRFPPTRFHISRRGRDQSQTGGDAGNPYAFNETDLWPVRRTERCVWPQTAAAPCSGRRRRDQRSRSAGLPTKEVFIIIVITLVFRGNNRRWPFYFIRPLLYIYVINTNLVLKYKVQTL